ncbi:putative membrane protein [Wolbachia endosymbiont of Drosophila ananassae]|nr:putative membrane protein [Wolbachia endosymbiont of Drosophila ananassae]RLT62560.1 putative membrane protein [Wolbachia endosymbiont of Drosophila ananassae]
MIHHQVFIKSKLLALPLVIPVLNTGMTPFLVKVVLKSQC